MLLILGGGGGVKFTKGGALSQLIHENLTLQLSRIVIYFFP